MSNSVTVLSLRHARHYLTLAQTSTDWRAVEVELDQINRAWIFGTGSAENAELTLSFIWAMRPFLEQRALWRQAVAWYEHGIVAARSEIQTHDLTALWNDAGAAHYALSDWTRAQDCHAQALKLFREIEDAGCQAKSLNGLGLVAQAQRQWTDALSYYDQALEFFREEKDVLGEATILHNAGQVYAEMEQCDQAIANYEQVLTIRRAQDDQVAVALTLNNLAAASQNRAELVSPNDRGAILSQAMEYQTGAQTIFAELGHRFYHAVATGNLSTLAQRMGQLERAAALSEEALKIFREIGAVSQEAATLSNLGGVFDSLGDYAHARAYQLHAAELYSAQGRQADHAVVLDNIAATFQAEKKLSEALMYRHQALDLWRSLHDQTAEANSLAAIGKIHLEQRKFEAAEKVLETAHRLLANSDYHAYAAITLNDLGLAYHFQKKRNDARYAYERALKLATELGDDELDETVSHNLARLEMDGRNTEE